MSAPASGAPAAKLEKVDERPKGYASWPPPDYPYWSYEDGDGVYILRRLILPHRFCFRSMILMNPCA